MVQKLKPYLAIGLAFVLGVVASILVTGCQPAAPPAGPTPTGSGKKAATSNSTTGAAAPAKAADGDANLPGGAKLEGGAFQPPAPGENPAPPASGKDEPASTPESPTEAKPAPTEAPPGAPEKPAGDQGAAAAPATTTVAAAAPAEGATPIAANAGFKPAIDKSANAPIKAGDWVQWGGTSYRNNVPLAENIPLEWAPGEFDRKTGAWKKDAAQNVKWVANLGSQTYGNPVIADGRIYVGTNNSGGYLKRYPSDVDLGVLLCINEADGKFLWQHSSEKLPTGRVHDWPMQGICCSPYVEGNRLWFVTSRGEVRCLDTEGFYDGEDDGPVTNDPARLFDVMKNEDPAQDQVAGILAGLKDGKLTDALRGRFAAAGAELPAEVAVKTDEEGKRWSFTATTGGAERLFRIQLVGPRLSVFKILSAADKDEADVVWVFDMMKEMGVSQHNMCSCSVTALGDILFVCTSNGVDESHLNIPSPDAPSFFAMNKQTGKVYWTDKSPGGNIHHGQWSSPTVAVLGGVPQVLFGGGDGWLYSFRADEGQDGKPELLWRADLNPKDAVLILGGRGTRNDIIGTPVVYDGLVYVAVGQDPEHGEGIGHLYCIDPTKRGDVSEVLAVDRASGKVIPHRRVQAVEAEKGEVAIPNPNSAVVWRYSTYDANQDKKIDFEETMHRTCGTVAIKNDLLFITDFSGLIHCVDAKSGKVYWTYDMLAASWGSALIVGDHVYIGDEDGDIVVFKLTAEKHDPVFEVNMLSSVYTSPVVANGVLYIANKDHLFAIAEDK
ncbi:MAG: PQQ-binding-like beta-propeller repeat protein [Pirellulales bacterium]